MRRWRSAVILCAAVLAAAPLPPSWVERGYSNGLYPYAQSVLTALSNAVPFALFDVLLVTALVWLVWRTTADVFGSRRSLGRGGSQGGGGSLGAGGSQGVGGSGGGVVARLFTAAAIFYLAFLACWGLNYRRLPVTDRLVFDSARIAPARARDLALAAVERANALYAEAHASDGAGFNSESLERGFARAEQQLGVQKPARPARPKRTLLDTYFRLAAVDGMTDPYFLETLVVSDLMPFERPFVVAHEWGHLAGFADESEANFVGWLACIRGGSTDQYSGWLFLYSEIAGGLRRADYVQVSARLASGPRQDLRAVSDRVRQHQNQTVSAAGWRVYDSYLKANRVPSGTASYAEVVRLILGTEFDEGWTPRLRN